MLDLHYKTASMLSACKNFHLNLKAIKCLNDEEVVLFVSFSGH